MNVEKIEQLKNRLVLPITGPGRRGRWAARRLAAAAVGVKGDHAQVRAIAQRAFEASSDQEVVNAVCAVWAETRNPWLADMLTAIGSLPTEPPRLRVLTALGAGRPEVRADADPDSARALVGVAEDDRARRGLADVVEIRRIGHRLDEVGGMALMRDVAACTGRLCRSRLAERRLNGRWNRIGDWLGPGVASSRLR
ncbi:hypothetical protein [Amycolatopsis sp. A1MSW2902]|uniref:hypothetical protein n=1 Tax=Amycolatopsis sp. A1MSW2902 TaxID=687413 RepID=UPI00307E6B91